MTAAAQVGAAKAGRRSLRPAVVDDLPEVLALFDRTFPGNGWRGQPPRARADYFRDVFFGNPWLDAAIPSLVAEADQRVIGFIGVMPRRMIFNGKPLRVAVACNLMVDPDRGDALVAVQLLKALFAGRQDLTLSDGATARMLEIWTRAGGVAPLAYNFHWLRPLRPARFALDMLGERRLLGATLKTCLTPLAAAADAVATRLRPNRPRLDAAIRYEPLVPESLAADFAELGRNEALQPHYDAASLRWLMNNADGERKGRLRARRVVEGTRLLGWYIYYLRDGRASEVLQLAARPRARTRVLETLFADAVRNGATALRGRVDPAWARELSQRHCWSRWDEPAMLVHARDPDILRAIERGDAFLSLLEGERWLRLMSG